MPLMVGPYAYLAEKIEPCETSNVTLPCCRRDFFSICQWNEITAPDISRAQVSNSLWKHLPILIILCLLLPLATILGSERINFDLVCGKSKDHNANYKEQS